MKIKNGFVVRQMAGTTVVVPVEGDLDMDMMITLNDTGAYLWNELQEEKSVEDLVNAVLRDYEIDADSARDYIVPFVNKLKEHGFLE